MEMKKFVYWQEGNNGLDILRNTPISGPRGKV